MGNWIIVNLKWIIWVKINFKEYLWILQRFLYTKYDKNLKKQSFIYLITTNLEHNFNY